jgi:threonylcarbamoyladenosine tRNA methylthiotransferase CDKAL1
MERLDGLWWPSLKVLLAHIPDYNNPLLRGAPSRAAGTPREIYDRAKRGFTIRLNHGCLLACSYCVIRLATGRLKSVSPDLIEAQFQEAISRAEPTVMLVGGDTGAYGRDLGTNLPQLLKRLIALGGDQRIFVHDLNANWFIEDMQSYASVFRDCARLQALCIPVQSGSDRILRLMRRPYKSADVVRALKVTWGLAPHILIGTHIIAGFPGETKEDFNQTLALIREFPFDFVTCFRYSEHPSANAVRLGPKIPEDEKRSRLSNLRTILGPAATILT